VERPNQALVKQTLNAVYTYAAGGGVTIVEKFNERAERPYVALLGTQAEFDENRLTNSRGTTTNGHTPQPTLGQRSPVAFTTARI
jgi:hypothetical protein